MECVKGQDVFSSRLEGESKHARKKACGDGTRASPCTRRIIGHWITRCINDVFRGSADVEIEKPAAYPRAPRHLGWETSLDCADYGFGSIKSSLLSNKGGKGTPLFSIPSSRFTAWQLFPETRQSQDDKAEKKEPTDVTVTGRFPLYTRSHSSPSHKSPSAWLGRQVFMLIKSSPPSGSCVP